MVLPEREEIMNDATYTNTDERFGDCVSGLTIRDFRKQAAIFGIEPSTISADEDHVYYCADIIGHRD